MKIKYIISSLFLIIILLLGLSFATINANSVSVNYYLGIKLIPLSLLLVYTLGVGILLGFLTTVIPLLKLKKENHTLKNTLKKEHSLQNTSSLTKE